MSIISSVFPAPRVNIHSITRENINVFWDLMDRGEVKYFNLYLADTENGTYTLYKDKIPNWDGGVRFGFIGSVYFPIIRSEVPITVEQHKYVKVTYTDKTGAESALVDSTSTYLAPYNTVQTYWDTDGGNMYRSLPLTVPYNTDFTDNVVEIRKLLGKEAQSIMVEATSQVKVKFNYITADERIIKSGDELTLSKGELEIWKMYISNKDSSYPVSSNVSVFVTT